MEKIKALSRSEIHPVEVSTGELTQRTRDKYHFPAFLNWLIDRIPLSEHKRREAKRFIKFATVGAMGAVTDFTVLNVLIQSFGMLEEVANAFSFTAAVAQNFTLNRLWTFPESKERKVQNQLTQFALVSVIGLGINTLIFSFIHRGLEPFWIDWLANEHWGHIASYNFAKLFAIGVVLFWNFTANRLWTYRGL
jgi:putative flippase GtrA